MGRAQANAGRFPVTHWTLVGSAGVDDTRARRSLAEVLAVYQPALCKHLERAKRMPADRAEDLVQGFIADRVLEKNLVAAADKDKGKFRTFLLTALDRYVINRYQHETRQKRSPKDGQVVAVDEQMVAGEDTSADTFDIAWARQTLSAAVERMQEECGGSGREDVWGVFEARLYRPMLEGVEPVDYDQLIERFGFGSPTQASNVLMTGKRMFTRHLRGVVGEYAGDDEQVGLEIAELQRVLAAAMKGAA